MSLRRSVGVVIAVALVVPLALTSAPSPVDAGSGVNAQTAHSFTYDGLTRNYFKYVPSGMPAGPRPLVMVLHGGSESATKISEPGDPRSHWKELADTDKFIVVYPDGVSNQWHDCRSDGHGAIGTADDVGFLTSLIANVDASHDVDLTRVYSTGFSNGGIMSMRLAAEATDQFAAVGPGIAGRAVDPAAECRAPDRAITVALMPGDADTRMPWNGGCVWDQQCTRGTVQGGVATRDYWIGVNGTGSTVDETFNYANTYADDGPSTVTRSRYLGGTNGTEVAWFRVNGGGHNTPSTHHHIGSLLVGPQNRDVESSTELWNIMKNFTRPTAVAVAESTPFTDGFESGNLNNWVKTGTVTASTTTPTSGSYVAQIAGTGVDDPDPVDGRQVQGPRAVRPQDERAEQARRR